MQRQIAGNIRDGLSSPRGSGARSGGRCAVSHERQAKGKRSAGPWFRLNRDGAVMFLNQFTGDQQPQSRAPVSLGAEEPGKQFFLNFRAHPASVIDYFEADLIVFHAVSSNRDSPLFVGFHLEEAGIQRIGYQIG